MMQLAFLEVLWWEKTRFRDHYQMMKRVWWFLRLFWVDSQLVIYL